VLDNPYFGFDILRKSVVLFGTVFEDIVVKRFDAGGKTLKDIEVPIAYAPKEKVLQRLVQDPNLDRPTALNLPRMSFDFTSLRYDGTRKLTSTTKFAALGSTPDRFKRLYVPVPYDINFNLYIYAKNIEDINKIVEQILPFFTPDWTPTVHLIPDMLPPIDIPIILNDGVAIEDKYEGALQERQVIIHTLNFTMRTYFFGPEKDKPIIKFVINQALAVPTDVNIGDAVDRSDASAKYITQPGLTANGQPTNVLASSIDPHLILVTDNFGYVETVTREGYHANNIPGEITTGPDEDEP